MNRRRFLVLSTCAAGVMLLPFEMVSSGLTAGASAVPNGQPRRMLYGSAGTACAQFPDSVAPPDAIFLPAASF
jgi:hypothetical protein